MDGKVEQVSKRDFSGVKRLGWHEDTGKFEISPCGCVELVRRGRGAAVYTVVCPLRPPCAWKSFIVLFAPRRGTAAGVQAVADRYVGRCCLDLSLRLLCTMHISSRYCSLTSISVSSSKRCCMLSCPPLPRPGKGWYGIVVLYQLNLPFFDGLRREGSRLHLPARQTRLPLALPFMYNGRVASTGCSPYRPASIVKRLAINRTPYTSSPIYSLATIVTGPVESRPWKPLLGLSVSKIPFEDTKRKIHWTYLNS